MILYFADRSFNICGIASTSLDSRFVVTSDTKTESVSNAASVFEADISYYDEDRLEIDKLTNAGNYVLRYETNEYNSEEGSKYSMSNITDIFTIVESENDLSGRTVNVYAEDLGLDLLNDLAYPYSSDGVQTIRKYLLDHVTKAGFTIGIDEIGAVKKAYSFDNTTTLTERVNEIAALFECEISYSFDITGMRITNKKIDVRKKRGKDTYEILSIGKNLNNIRVKNSISSLATAFRVTGNDNKPLDISHDDGDMYVAGGVLYSRKALEKWYRYSSQSGHIIRQFSYPTSNMKTLLDEAIKELKKVREPIQNYEVDIAILPEGVEIGDIVYVVDDSGELYVSGRILELQTSISSDRITATIGDYSLKSAGISTKVMELASQFSEIAQNRTLYTWIVYADDEKGTNATMSRVDKKYVGIYPNQLKDLENDSQLTSEIISKITFQLMLLDEPVSLYLSSVDGLIFRNKRISTTVVATLKIGDEYIGTLNKLREFYGSAYFVWSVDGVELETNDSRIKNDGFSLEYSDTNGVETADIRCSLVREAN